MSTDQKIEESEMALTIDIPVTSGSFPYPGYPISGGWDSRDNREPSALTAVVEVAPLRAFNAGRMEMLLDEPVFALWATEASARYAVSAVDALELLAYALFLDGER
jgi:hypothetical protein